MEKHSIILLLPLLFVPCFCVNSDITGQVFGNIKDGLIAAFGDFNSDELTDVFIIRNNSKTLQILFGSDTDDLLTKGPNCSFSKTIVNVIPGDFDGDALMDVLVVTDPEPWSNNLEIFIAWGESTRLECPEDVENPILKTYGEPLAIDYNNDMIIDLFGLNRDKERTYWIFGKDRKTPETKLQKGGKDHLKVPHAHAYLDLNDDFTADLFLQTGRAFEVWLGNKTGSDFFHSQERILPLGSNDNHIGQTLFLDVELKGEQNQILPLCRDLKCSKSAIYAYSENTFHDLNINFKDSQGILWGFIPPKSDDPYLKAITVRGGDFNMDGYPDLLATLVQVTNSSAIQTVLMENVPCQKPCNSLSRTFDIKWNALAPIGNDSIAGAFFDFFQDGILDVILIRKTAKNTFKPLAFRNTLDYDANFVKVIVLTGLTHHGNITQILSKRKKNYGTNLPGPRITYTTTTQEGDLQHGSSVQLPQSAYFAMQLPYTIFGLGRTPNFVDSLKVGLAEKSKTWTQLIPNSQMIVIPCPVDDPQRWKAQLFVTPSKLIVMSVIALGGTCLVIMLIILGLYIKEKREDRLEKLQEAQRFHFDAM